MKGTLTGVRKYCGSYFFIQGDDGVEYFAHKDEMANKRQFKHFAWNGNRASFDAEEAPGQERPRAVNILLEEIRDPEKLLRDARRAEERERIAAKAAEKAANIALAEKRRERKLREKEYEAEHLRYVAEYRKDDRWMPVRYLYSGKPAIFSAYNEASSALADMRKRSTEKRFRLRKAYVFGEGTDKPFIKYL